MYDLILLVTIDYMDRKNDYLIRAAVIKDNTT